MNMNYQFLIFIPENSAPDLVNLVCIFDGDITKGIGQLFIDFCKDRDEILHLLRNEYDGVYLDGDVFQYPYDEDNNITYLEYSLKVKNSELYEILVKIHNNKSTFNNKIGLETVMTKQAPYKLWTLEALKNECKQRQFDPATFTDVKDKSVLVKVLESDDVEAKKKTESKPVVTKPSGKNIVNKPQAPKQEKKVPQPPVEEVEEVEEVVETIVAPPVPKKKVPPVPKKTTENPAEKAMAETKKILDEQKPKKSPPNLEAVVNMNQKLRDAGLWVTGCQFLSTEQKVKLLNAKTDKDKKAIYSELEKKRSSINAVLSEKMKGKTVAKKAQAVVEEAPAEEEKVEVEVVEEAPKQEKKAPPVPKKKVPPVPKKK